MEDETVKVHCDIFDCRYNLWKKTNKSNCKLKYIEIGVRTVPDYEHAVEGCCTNMEIG
jgi:hypothetical protein